MPESNSEEVVVELPQQIIRELDGMAQKENVNRSECLRRAVKLYLREHNKRQIRESMRQGYMEMAKINLNIASEAFLAEEEAESTLERLVSGV
ncbi:CopG family ribbon-helix-helix protein [Tuberibacillus sp. Marseille-P3662]|uniref:CopG family ribbon-helix-helix protein n=1 Tax=Tuberibacillus sp. Marseille-P3662 TaxID=1965358 RepID=UPI000A1C9269|nr:ribbon-helix-helix protein, CopG family [Tuberibacillus sp. Marseille-P3662]